MRKYLPASSDLPLLVHRASLPKRNDASHPFRSNVPVLPRVLQLYCITPNERSARVYDPISVLTHIAFQKNLPNLILREKSLIDVPEFESLSEPDGPRQNYFGYGVPSKYHYGRRQMLRHTKKRASTEIADRERWSNLGSATSSGLSQSPFTTETEYSTISDPAEVNYVLEQSPKKKVNFGNLQWRMFSNLRERLLKNVAAHVQRENLKRTEDMLSNEAPLLQSVCEVEVRDMDTKEVRDEETRRYVLDLASDALAVSEMENIPVPVPGSIFVGDNDEVRLRYSVIPKADQENSPPGAVTGKTDQAATGKTAGQSGLPDLPLTDSPPTKNTGGPRSVGSVEKNGTTQFNVVLRDTDTTMPVCEIILTAAPDPTAPEPGRYAANFLEPGWRGSGTRPQQRRRRRPQKSGDRLKTDQQLGKDTPFAVASPESQAIERRDNLMRRRQQRELRQDARNSVEKELGEPKYFEGFQFESRVREGGFAEAVEKLKGRKPGRQGFMGSDEHIDDTFSKEALAALPARKAKGRASSTQRADKRHDRRRTRVEESPVDIDFSTRKARRDVHSAKYGAEQEGRHTKMIRENRRQARREAERETRHEARHQTAGDRERQTTDDETAALGRNERTHSGRRKTKDAVENRPIADVRTSVEGAATAQSRPTGVAGTGPKSHQSENAARTAYKARGNGIKSQDSIGYGSSDYEPVPAANTALSGNNQTAGIHNKTTGRADYGPASATTSVNDRAAGEQNGQSGPIGRADHGPASATTSGNDRAAGEQNGQSGPIGRADHGPASATTSGNDRAAGISGNDQAGGIQKKPTDRVDNGSANHEPGKDNFAGDDTAGYEPDYEKRDHKLFSIADDFTGAAKREHPTGAVGFEHSAPPQDPSMESHERTTGAGFQTKRSKDYDQQSAARDINLSKEFKPPNDSKDSYIDGFQREGPVHHEFGTSAGNEPESATSKQVPEHTAKQHTAQTGVKPQINENFDVGETALPKKSRTSGMLESRPTEKMPRVPPKKRDETPVPQKLIEQPQDLPKPPQPKDFKLEGACYFRRIEQDKPLEDWSVGHIDMPDAILVHESGPGSTVSLASAIECTWTGPETARITLGENLDTIEIKFRSHETAKDWTPYSAAIDQLAPLLWFKRNQVTVLPGPLHADCMELIVKNNATGETRAVTVKDQAEYEDVTKHVERMRKRRKSELPAFGGIYEAHLQRLIRYLKHTAPESLELVKDLPCLLCRVNQEFETIATRVHCTKEGIVAQISEQEDYPPEFRSLRATDNPYLELTGTMRMVPYSSSKFLVALSTDPTKRLILSCTRSEIDRKALGDLLHNISFFNMTHGFEASLRRQKVKAANDLKKLLLLCLDKPDACQMKCRRQNTTQWRTVLLDRFLDLIQYDKEGQSFDVSKLIQKGHHTATGEPSTRLSEQDIISVSLESDVEDDIIRVVIKDQPYLDLWLYPAPLFRLFKFFLESKVHKNRLQTALLEQNALMTEDKNRRRLIDVLNHLEEACGDALEVLAASTVELQGKDISDVYVPASFNLLGTRVVLASPESRADRRLIEHSPISLAESNTVVSINFLGAVDYSINIDYSVSVAFRSKTGPEDQVKVKFPTAGVLYAFVSFLQEVLKYYHRGDFTEEQQVVQNVSSRRSSLFGFRNTATART